MPADDYGSRYGELKNLWGQLRAGSTPASGTSSGQLYGYKGEKGRTTIEFARVLELTDDPELRAEAGLRALTAFPFVDKDNP